MRVLLIALIAALALPVAAHAGSAHPAAPFPDVLALPNGWQPEGIASGRGNELFVGSIPTGAVLRLDARTGARTIVVPGGHDRRAIGLKYSHGLLFVAGGPTGRAFVYDARTGADVANVVLTTDPSFINDVTLTRDAAWFTDSVNQRLYRVDRATYAVTVVPITGALQYDADPATFEANGIAAARGVLLVVQSRTGKLFRVDPATGVSAEVVLQGGDLANGDGLLLHGRVLYAVQNRLNRVAVVVLGKRLASGRIVRHIEDADFRVPTTVARKGRSLYLPNARFGTTPTPDTAYEVVRVDAGRKAHHRRGGHGDRRGAHRTQRR